MTACAGGIAVASPRTAEAQSANTCRDFIEHLPLLLYCPLRAAPLARHVIRLLRPTDRVRNGHFPKVLGRLVRQRIRDQMRRGRRRSLVYSIVLKHNQVDATMIYPRVLNRGTGVLSPLDDASAVPLHAGALSTSQLSVRRIGA